MLLVHQALDLGAVDTLSHLGHDIFADHRVSSQLVLCGADESFIQIYQLEHVADLHQNQELVLRHDLTELAVALGIFHVFTNPGLLMFGQLFRRHVADVSLVGHVGNHIFIGTNVVGELLQILRIRVDDLLSGLGGAGVEHHVRGMHQDITRAFDNAVHFVHCLSTQFIVARRGASMGMDLS